jgi:hypothetical protein
MPTYATTDAANAALAAYVAEPSHAGFALCEHIDQRTMIESAIDRCAVAVRYVAHETDPYDRTYVLCERDTGAYVTWLVCHSRALFPSRTVHLENGHYYAPCRLSDAARKLEERAGCERPALREPF